MALNNLFAIPAKCNLPTTTKIEAAISSLKLMATLSLIALRACLDFDLLVEN